MKKLLLFTALGSLALGAMAQSTPLHLENFYVNSISANGRYISSKTDMTYSLYDLETRKMIYTAEGDEIGGGQARSISDNGILLCSDYNVAWYVIDGKEIHPEVLSQYPISSICAITPDGKNVCGLVTNLQQGDIMDSTQYLPYVATITDGVMSELEFLPFPEKDFTNRTIQWASAVSLSDDGTKVIGLVTDYAGMLLYPILYTKGEDGKWTYDLITEQYINPNGLVLPEDPGEPKSWTNFATPEEVAAYNAALEKWQTETPSDYSLYPNWEDFLTDAEKEAWNAYAKEFNENQNLFYDTYNRILEESLSFNQNIIYLSPDGNKVAASGIVYVDTEDPWSGETILSPFTEVCEINLVDNSIELLDFTSEIAPSCILNDGTTMASTLPNFFDPTPQTSYIIEKGETITPLLDYIAVLNPEWATWYKNNFTYHEEVGYDPDTYEPIMGDVTYTGYPYSSTDGSVIATSFQNWYLDVPYNTVVFTGVTTGVANVAIDGADDLTVKGAKGGMIFVAGAPADVTVYDLSGRVVFAADAVEASVATGLNSGVYVIKATAENGKTVTEKVAF